MERDNDSFRPSLTQPKNCNFLINKSQFVGYYGVGVHTVRQFTRRAKDQSVGFGEKKQWNASNWYAGIQSHVATSQT